MSLQEIYYVAEMVVGIAVMISIVFVAIELRQNTYVTRKSMGAEREQRVNWLMETMATNNDFMDFYYRLQFEDGYDNLDKKERARAIAIGIRIMRPMLNELVAYCDGQISADEYHSLEPNIRRAKNRPYVNAAYEYEKVKYPNRVQNHWDKIEPMDYYRPRL